LGVGVGEFLFQSSIVQYSQEWGWWQTEREW